MTIHARDQVAARSLQEATLVVQFPLFPLGTVLFPGMVVPLHIFEPRYRTMIARRMNEDPMFGVVLTRSGREVGDRPEIYPIGTSASLLEAVRYTDGRFDIVVRGGRRFKVVDGNWDEGYLTGSIEWSQEPELSASEAEEAARLADGVRQAFDAYLEAFERATHSRIARADLGSEPREIGYAVAAMMPLSTTQRQRLLEEPNHLRFLADLLSTLRRERELLVSTGIGGAKIDHPGTRFSTN